VIYNELFDENSVNLAERLFLLYAKRWEIETNYRVKNSHSCLKLRLRTIKLGFSIISFFSFIA